MELVVRLLAPLLLFLPIASSHAPRTTGWVKPPTPDGVTAYDFEYQIDGASYTGYVAFPTSALPSPPAVPGVLVAHQWYGLGDMEQYRAEEMAATMGYVAFALDVYGTGVRAANDAEAEALMDALLADPSELRKRIDAGMDQLTAINAETNSSAIGSQGEGSRSSGGPSVNASALTANGYCFGGLMVLELARSGGAAKAVTSFHGELGNLTSQSEDKFVDGLTVSAHHAELDFQGDAALRGLEAELEAQNVTRWSTKYYGHMEHGWTDPSQAVYSYVEAESAHADMFGLYKILFP
jgi:dienelactone hydrolase